MAYPRTQSILDTRIKTGLSTQITIKVENTTVGAIQQLTINQAREMNVFEEIGTEGVVEICPKGAAKISLTVDRIVFDGLRLPEALARGFVNLQAQRFPFDIHLVDTALGNDQLAVTTVIHGCWINDYSPTYKADSFIVSERASLKAERITISQAGHSAVWGGLRGIAFDYDTVERSTDVNGKIGRLDSAGFPLQT